MKLSRRKFLHLTAGVFALPAVPCVASALDYPTRPVHIIVGLPAGLNPDIVARLMSQWLSDRLGKSFFVENRPGAGTNMATEAVVRAPADGYSLLLSTPSNAINATLYEKLNFDFIRDFAPIASLVRVPYVMEVTSSFPAKTVPEFVAYAKANPDKIKMASAGNGSTTQIFGEMFKIMAGVNFVHIPYRGNYLPDLVSGQVDVAFTPVSASLDLIKSEKLRALAVTTATRVDVLPDVPTVGEFVPGYEASAWDGFCAPKNTPAEIVERLNKEINAGLADSKLKARLTELGNVPMPMTVAGFAKFIQEDTEKWAKVIKSAGIKPD
jgi:tripartite-type tricarboxylate transporter receptor subunit TctC